MFGLAAKARCPLVVVDGITAEYAAIAVNAAIAESPHSLSTFCIFVISVAWVMVSLDKRPTGASHP